jgi:hypothetical protein
MSDEDNCRGNRHLGVGCCWAYTAQAERKAQSGSQQPGKHCSHRHLQLSF